MAVYAQNLKTQLLELGQALRDWNLSQETQAHPRDERFRHELIARAENPHRRGKKPLERTRKTPQRKKKSKDFQLQVKSPFEPFS